MTWLEGAELFALLFPLCYLSLFGASQWHTRGRAHKKTIQDLAASYYLFLCDRDRRCCAC